jgi:urease accessory protein UreH
VEEGLKKSGNSNRSDLEHSLIANNAVTGLIEPLNKLSTGTVAIGASPLREGGLGIKVLAQDGLALRKAVLQIWEALIQASGIEFPHSLKRAQTFFY